MNTACGASFGFACVQSPKTQSKRMLAPHVPAISVKNCDNMLHDREGLKQEVYYRHVTPVDDYEQ
jgi:hypothetical protein